MDHLPADLISALAGAAGKDPSSTAALNRSLAARKHLSAVSSNALSDNDASESGVIHGDLKNWELPPGDRMAACRYQNLVHHDSEPEVRADHLQQNAIARAKGSRDRLNAQKQVSKKHVSLLAHREVAPLSRSTLCIERWNVVSLKQKSTQHPCGECWNVAMLL